MNPGHLVFGQGCINDFQEDIKKLGKKKLFLVTIPELQWRVEQMAAQLTEYGIEVAINTDLKGEPSFADFKRLRHIASEFEADSVVGIGGGSVLDVAKLLAAMLDSDEDPREYAGIGLLPERNIYLACLPTTAGTGSEVSPNAIFLDEIDGGKKGIISPFLVPDAAYVDPELTIGVPPAITAATGIDAFTHCLEAYVNNFSHPMIDLYALEGMKLIAANLLEAVNHGNNIAARTAVALGSVYGGMCLGPVNTGAIHALSYPLGSKYKIAHGLSNALLMPYVVEFNLPGAVEKYATVARLLGASDYKETFDTAMEGVLLLKNWVSSCGLPTRLSEIGIPSTEIECMAHDALKIQRLLKNNVREVTIDDAISIYTNAF